MMKTHLGPILAKTDKAFYGGIAKLHGYHKLVRHNGRVYSPSAFNKFQLDVKAGLVVDEPVRVSGQRSEMGEAIKVFLHRKPDGARVGDIIQALSSNSSFAKAISKNKTHIYNVLSRLIKTGEISRKDGVYAIVVPNEAAQKQHGVSTESEDTPRVTGGFATPSNGGGHARH